MGKKLFLAASFAATISFSAFASAACTEYTSSNSHHVAADRAYTCGYVYACAEGSGENLGFNNALTITTLKEDPEGYFEKGTCPAGEAPEVIGVVSINYTSEEPNKLTPKHIEIVDVDGDLDLLGALKVIVTTSRDDEPVSLNCEIAKVEGSATEFESTSCESYTAEQWGNYTFTPEVTDQQGNVAEGEPRIHTIRDGSERPEITSSSHTLDGTVLTITGTANDLDGDLDSVIIGVMPAYGDVCEGTYSFTCVVDTAAYPEIFIPGNPVTFEVYAKDSVGNMSDDVDVTIVIPELVQHAPTIDTHEYTVEGNIITFTGTASDLDGDLDRVVLTLGAAGGIVCDGAANFTCIFEAPRAGSYALGVVAVDSRDVFGEVAGPYEIIIEDQVCYTATNQEHIDAGRAELKYNVLVYALGSGDYLGMTSNTTSVEQQVQPGNWVKVDSCQ